MGEENKHFSFLQNIQPPPKLDMDSSGVKDRWKEWKAAWGRYILLSGIDKQPKPFQCALLLHTIGIEAVRVHDGLHFGDVEDKEDPAVVIKKFDEFFMGETRDFIERMKFYRRKQENNETFEQFLSALRILAKSCGFCKCMNDTLIMDRIIDGHAEEKVRDKLVRQDKLNLQTALNICRSMEVTAENLKVVKQEPKEDEVNSLQHRSKLSARPSRQEGEKPCKFCTYRHILRKEKCPAWGKSCNTCGAKNHFGASELCRGTDEKRKGRSTRSKRINTVTKHSCDSDSDDSVESITVVTTEEVSALGDPKSKPIYCKMTIDEHPVVHQIDPGATVCVLPLHHTGGRDIRKEKVNLKLYNRSTIATLGKCKIPVRNEKTGKKWNVDYVVVHDPMLTPLLSRKAAEIMQLITVNYENFELVNTVCPPNPQSTVLDSFTTVFDQDLGTLPGGKIHLTVEDGADPVVRPPRTLPESCKAKVKEELERLEAIGVLQKVDGPTDWISQMSVVKKRSGEIRICIDPRPLNNVLKREHFMLPVLEDILPELSDARMFSVFDLKMGYWHCELDDPSSYLTTFATPFGRYRWLRLPFGLKVSSEIFQKRLVHSLENLQGVQCVADDIIIYGKDSESHDENVKNFLQRCQTLGIKLNKEKSQHRVREIKFLGHLLGDKGLKADPQKISAVLNMERPVDKEGVQRLRGTVGYLAKFIPNLSVLMQPLNDLTKADVPFQWTQTEENAFIKVKDLLTKAPVLAYFDASKQLVVQCDASSRGIGAALLQDGRPISYASRALTDTESRYSIMEKEMLAVVFSLERWHQYTYGRHVIVYSDHKPLQSISRKPLDKAPKRLQSMLMRALTYDIDIQYKEGRQMLIADTLSRAYLPLGLDDVPEEKEIINVITHLPVGEDKFVSLQQETAKDSVLTKLKEVIQNGWPKKHQIPVEIGVYFGQRDELAIMNGLVFRGERLIIPKTMRKLILADMHHGHIGIESMLRRARESVYWPCMSNDVKDYVLHCDTCCEFGQSQCKEPLQCHELPHRAWQKVGCDLFTIDNKDYMVTVCYYSNFWELDRLYDTTSKSVITKLKAHFARYGIPEEFMSDNGPQFSSSCFKKFASKWDITLSTSSPYHPQSNGKAEAAVKAAKTMLRKTKNDNEDPFLAMLNIRNIPQQGVDLSPAQRLMGHRTRTVLPTTTKLLKDQAECTGIATKLKERQGEQQFRYNKSGVKSLPELNNGDSVRVAPQEKGKKMWEKATVIKKHRDRSYVVQTNQGQIVRNRVHLRKFPASHNTGVEYEDTDDDYTPGASADLGANAVPSEQDSVQSSEQESVETTCTRPPEPLRRSSRLVKKPARLGISK